MTRRVLLVLALALAVAAAPPAHAGFFPGDQVDGPSHDIERLGGIDVAEDGGAAVTYLKAGHAFVARMENGVWLEPEQLDEGFGSVATETDVARIDDGRIVAIWVTGGDLWVRVRPAGAMSWSPPERVWAGGVSDADVDMSIHGVGYVAFRSGGDVRVSRMSRADDSWTPVSQPVDNEPARTAGHGEGPRIVAVQDGTGWVLWEEEGGDGRRHVWSRRVIRTQLSPNPREVSVDSFEGRPGLDAGAPSADIEYDSNYGVVAFEQSFVEGAGVQRRVLARRLVGVELEGPVAADGLGWGAESAQRPRVDLNARGETLIGVTQTPSNTPVAADFDKDFLPRGMFRLDESPGPNPAFTVTGVADTGEAVAGWLEDTGAGGVPTMTGRFFAPVPDPVRPPRVRPEPPAPLSSSSNGAPLPELGIEASSDRVGDTAFAYIQGSAEGRRLMVGVYDRPPRSTVGRTDPAWKTDPRHRFAWSPVVDLWGGARYRVELNGVEPGTTRRRTFEVGTTTNRTLKPSFNLPDGRQRWRVVTFDIRGQTAVGSWRPFNLEGNPPFGRMTILGASGRSVRLEVVVHDPGRGLRSASLSFGDGSRSMSIRAPRRRTRPVRRTVSHRYRSAGTFTARLAVRDMVGHRTVYQLRVPVQ